MATRPTIINGRQLDVMTPAEWLRVVAGGESKQNGQDAEDLLDKQHEDYKTVGLAIIDKLSPPSRIVNAQTQTAKITGRAPIDFGGMLCGSGRAVYAELKSTVKPEPSLKLAPPPKPGRKVAGGLRVEQVAHMAHRAIGGALVTLLWYRAGQLGLLLPDVFRRVVVDDRWALKRYQSIKADHFHWLKFGDLDWLAPLGITTKTINKETPHGG